MKTADRIRVAKSPAKPVLLFDGDCHFCRRWVERWAQSTGDAVEYRPFQEAAAQFPEIPRAHFDRAVQLVEPSGKVSSGADAVVRALENSDTNQAFPWIYRKVPGAAFATDRVYEFIARRRGLASAATRLLWGDDVRRPTYSGARDWFLRSLGAIYFIAFTSLWGQVDGLIGRNGILPVAEFLPAARAQLGASAVTALPTLCWLNSSDAFLHFLCGTGIVLSVLLIVGVAPLIALLLLFLSYLSLTIAGQTFLSFQWDMLLLETGFLAIFIAPGKWWSWRSARDPSRVGLFLLKLLLLKLMFMSGVVKLTSGDSSWWDLSALDYHYWTQPLPTVFAWWADKNPEWLKKATVAVTIFIEIVGPFFIWAPRRLRVPAAMVLIALQVGIALTGNYCFFNLLTAALCVLLIDDHIFRRPAAIAARQRSQSYIAVLVLLVTFPINAMLLYSALRPDAEWPRPITALYSCAERFRIVNGYGLFRVMTKTRPEIVIEGSADGSSWLPYRFRWKPGDIRIAPGWVAPHQPRLAWQMWFAALGSYRENAWFVRLVERLLENSPEVVGLLETNPFANAPPRYVRATSYDYRFTTLAERRATGAWWSRSGGAEYLPAVSLEDFGR